MFLPCCPFWHIFRPNLMLRVVNKIFIPIFLQRQHSGQYQIHWLGNKPPKRKSSKKEQLGLNLQFLWRIHTSIHFNAA